MAADSNDSEHDALADLVDEVLGEAERDQAWVITTRLAAAATPAVRDALTDSAAGHIAAMNTTWAACIDVRVDDDVHVMVTVADCSLGVAQEVAREFLRYCTALRVEIAELVSIVPAP